MRTSKYVWLLLALLVMCPLQEAVAKKKKVEKEEQSDREMWAESFLRGYDALWLPLDEQTKARYIEEFTQLRRVDPPYTNWLLFSATVECFLRKAGAKSDTYRIVSALRKVEEWYVGGIPITAASIWHPWHSCPWDCLPAILSGQMPPVPGPRRRRGKAKISPKTMPIMNKVHPFVLALLLTQGAIGKAPVRLCAQHVAGFRPEARLVEVAPQPVYVLEVTTNNH